MLVQLSTLELNTTPNRQFSQIHAINNTVYYSFRAFRCTVPASLDAHRYLFYFRKNRYQSTTNKQKMLVKQNKNADTRKGCNASAISYRLSNI